MTGLRMDVFSVQRKEGEEKKRTNERLSEGRRAVIHCHRWHWSYYVPSVFRGLYEHVILSVYTTTS